MGLPWVSAVSLCSTQPRMRWVHRSVGPLGLGFGLCLSNWQEVCHANRLPHKLLSHLQGQRLLLRHHTSLLRLLCQFRSSWCTPMGACSALIHNRRPLPEGSGHIRRTIPLVGHSTALRLRSSSQITHQGCEVWGLRGQSLQRNTTLLGMGHAR